MKRLPILAIILLLQPAATAVAQKQFGFDNRQSTGQPYLPAEETVRRMTVPDGFTVTAFAAEPLVVNPIAFTVDERGRVWVVECFEYPARTPAGKMPRDRIVILEDTDGDGRADSRKIFAEGKDFPARFDLASGIEVGRGGVFLGAPPYLWFIENRNDKPGKFEILLRGFGSQDTHETLNTFHWGPDGWLHGLHGVFTQSEVNGVKLNAAVWRYEPGGRKFEIFAEGTSNPWGIDHRNTDGQHVLACCVIPHLFHVFPGGNYKRQAGGSFNNHAYGYLDEICDHTFHKESGWAHAGLISLDTPVVPKEYHSSVIFGSIHGSSLKQNILTNNGSTYVARKGPDFLTSGDKNVRPINLRWGPGGEIYLIDWHDQNPCHQAAPNSWDHHHGRIYRIAHGKCPPHRPGDLAAWSTADLVALASGTWTGAAELAARLKSAARTVSDTGLSPWWPRTARRLLSDRRDALDPAAKTAIRATGDPSLMTATGLWTEADFAANPTEAGVRALGEIPTVGPDTLARLAAIAAETPSPRVCREIASAVRRWPRLDTLPILHALMSRSDDASDPTLPLMIWYAYEPRLIANAAAEFDWLLARAGDNRLIRDPILPRAARRLASADDHRERVLTAAAAATGEIRRKILAGMTDALANRQVPAPPSWAAARAALTADADDTTRKLVDKLAVSLSDVASIRRAVAVLSDASQPAAARLDAVKALALSRSPDGLPPLVKAVAESRELPLRLAACRALAAFDAPEVVKLLDRWAEWPAELRTDYVNLLAGRKTWAKELLTAVGRKHIDRAALTPALLERIQAFQDKDLTATIEKVWGKVRPSPAELLKLIDELRDDLDRHAGSFGRGRAVFEQQCAKCHQFGGRGYSVGPPLEGAGRDIEYILANVIDPNRAVGTPYFVRRAVMSSGRIEEGLLAAEDDRTITLKAENDAVKVLQRADIDELQVVERSVMPEGLAYNMTRENFRDLVRYLMVHPFVTDWSTVKAGVTGRVTIPQTDGKPLEARFAAGKSLTTKLLIGGSVPLTIRLDDSVIYAGTPGAAPARPDQVEVEITVTPGDHKLTLEGPAGATVYVRFHDPDRVLRYPDSTERPQ